jgi:multidrug efflux pump subunit AcrB
LSEQEIYDLTLNQVRVGLISVPGASIPLPYGGKVKVVSVDLDLKGLEANNLAPSDVITALSAQNLVLPNGTAKIGDTEYDVYLNTSPRVLERLNELPIKMINGAVIRIRDVAQVRDGYSPQVNMVRLNGVPSAWESLHSAVSRPFPKPTTGRIAVKVINHLGDEVMKVFPVS